MIKANFLCPGFQCYAVGGSGGPHTYARANNSSIEVAVVNTFGTLLCNLKSCREGPLLTTPVNECGYLPLGSPTKRSL